MARAAKKRKTNAGAAVAARVKPERFPCFTCATDRTSKQFPDFNPTPECEHLINTCKVCLRGWVESCVGCGNFVTGRKDVEDGDGGKDGEGGDEIRKEGRGVRCPHPGCEGVMRNFNVQDAVSKKVHAKFELLEMKHIGDTTPGWRWCLEPTCPGGQVHESPAPPTAPEQDMKPTQPKRTRHGFFKNPSSPPPPAPAPPAEPDIFTCPLCSAQACVPCNRPWHEGETCTEYRARTKDRFEEEDQALRTIGKVTKKCPGCGKRIERNGGCPRMICSLCRVNWCWLCGGQFTQNGCKCRRR